MDEVSATTSLTDPQDVATEEQFFSQSESSTEKAQENSDSELINDVIYVLFYYVYPILVITGIIANLLIVILITRPRNRRLATFMNILVLAVCDALVLILDFINNFFKGILGIPTIGFNSGVCVVYRWLFNTLFTFSAWVVVITTVQRLIVIWKPFQVLKSSHSKKKDGFLLLGFFVASALLCFYNLFAWSSKDDNCDIADGWEEFHATQSQFIVYSFYSYIPTVILFFCNAAIIRILRRTSSTQLAESDPRNKQRIKNSVRVTRTVLTISFSFLLLTVPVSLFFMYQFYTSQTVEMSQVMFLLETCFLLLVLTNHSINFFLYVATIKSFRADCKRLLLCWRVEEGSVVSDNAQHRSGVTASTGLGTSKAPTSSVD